MRIAQLTFNVYDNYGNMLQKYALHRVLRRYAEQVDVLWCNVDNFLPETWEQHWQYQLAKMMNSASERRRFVFEVIRQSKFKEFAERYIRTRFDFRSLEDLADQYEYFVVGSDQVWNPEFPESFIPGRFLTFAAREKRIAYAASIAIPQLHEQVKPIWRRGISEMPHVSVREKVAADIIEELVGKRPPVLIDPSFLLTAEEWSKVSLRPSWIDERYARGYILTYFLGDLPPVDMKKISSELGLPIVNLLQPDVFDHYNVGPSEFLWLIAHASLVYTNSFHGTAFSILTARPFVFCDYLQSGSPIRRLSRIYSLLEDFKLTSRTAVASNGFILERPTEIDYAERESVLERERSKAKQFLDAALRGAAHED